MCVTFPGNLVKETVTVTEEYRAKRKDSVWVKSKVSKDFID